MSPLRDYQAQALDRIRLAYARGCKAPLVQAPTGTGKTRIAVEACFQHVSRGGSVLFIAPRRELVSQAYGALQARGCVMDVNTRVRSIQAITKLRELVPPASLIVYDEARHYVADQWSVLERALPDAFKLGLDATPERGDGRGLGDMFDALIETISVGDAVHAGYLVPCTTIRPDHALEPAELAVHPVVAYSQRALDRSTVIFAPTVDLAREWARDINANTTSHAEALWGDMPTSCRDEVLAAYEAGEVDVLVNVNLLTEGWDSPRTSCVILGRSFGTVSGLLQAVGRGMRPYQGKQDLLLLDLVGATHVHGEPHESITWHLEGKAARRAVTDVDVRFCPVCGVPSPAGVECSACGYSGEKKKRKPRVLGLPIDRFARQRSEGTVKKLKALKWFLTDARMKGYSPTWATKKYEHIYGEKVTEEMRRAARRA